MITTKSMFAKTIPSLIIKEKDEIVLFMEKLFKKGFTNHMVGERLTKKRWTFAGAKSVNWSENRVKTFHRRNRRKEDKILQKKEPYRNIYCPKYSECLNKQAKINKSLYCELCEREGKKYAGIQNDRKNTQTFNLS